GVVGDGAFGVRRLFVVYSANYGTLVVFGGDRGAGVGASGGFRLRGDWIFSAAAGVVGAAFAGNVQRDGQFFGYGVEPECGGGDLRSLSGVVPADGLADSDAGGVAFAEPDFGVFVWRGDCGVG